MGPVFADWDWYLPNGTSICRTRLVFDKQKNKCVFYKTQVVPLIFFTNGTAVSFPFLGGVTGLTTGLLGFGSIFNFFPIGKANF